MYRNHYKGSTFNPEFIEDFDIDAGIDVDDETLVYHLTLPEDEDLDKQFDNEEMNPVDEV